MNLTIAPDNTAAEAARLSARCAELNARGAALNREHAAAKQSGDLNQLRAVKAKIAQHTRDVEAYERERVAFEHARAETPPVNGAAPANGTPPVEQLAP